MIVPELHRRVQPLEPARHRALRLRLPITDRSFVAGMNALFVALQEFGDACRDYPLVFVAAGKDEQGNDDVAPVAVFGLQNGQNLYLEGDDWRAAYRPVHLANYPFAIGRVDAERFAMCIDADCSALAEDGAGERLFDDDGTATELLKGAQERLARFEADVDRTRRAGRRLMALELLRPMRFDATLPDGAKLVVDGFLAVDDKRLQGLDDATVLELHRDGLLAALHAHLFSLGHMRRLVQWHAERAARAGQASKPD